MKASKRIWIAAIALCVLLSGTAQASGCALKVKCESGACAAGDDMTISWQCAGAADSYDIWLTRGGAVVGEATVSGGESGCTIPGGYLKKAGKYTVYVTARSGRYTAKAKTKFTVSKGESSSAGSSQKPTADTGVSMSSMAAQVVSETNSDRAKYGLSALTADPELTRAACVRAREIVEKFSHTRPDGTSCFTVSGKARGENIAKGQQSAAKVMAAWMSSDGHRANILRASYRTIGVCAYEVNGVMYWVQLFGN